MAKEKKRKHELHKMVVEEAQKKSRLRRVRFDRHIPSWIIGIQLEGGPTRLSRRRRQAPSV